MKERMMEETKDEPNYNLKVKKMLEIAKEHYQGNYKVCKTIDKVEPLYDIHEFWDSQPVPKPNE
jgi:hypothetical protein